MAIINVPDDKNTIQKAIDNANSGDTIKIFDSGGPYNESIIINKKRLNGLTLEGVNNPTIKGDGVNSGSQPHATIHVDDGNGPTRNITIDGLTIKNPNGKFGIFAGTGTTNSDLDGIGGLEIINNTIEDISTTSSGGSLTGGPAGIGIRGDYGTDGNPGIDIGQSDQGNVIKNVQSDGFTNAVGITLKSFTGDAGFGFDSSGNSVTDSSSPPATDTDIVDNDISKINGGDKSRTKGISVSGEFEDVLVEGNSITDITAADDGSAGNAFGITFTENGGSYSGNKYDIDNDGNGERIGPRDFDIKENDIDNLTAGDPSALFIGGYEDLGDHSVKNNNFRDGTVSRFAGNQAGYQIGDGDTLNAEENWWGDSTGPDGIISPSNTNNPVTLPDGDGITVLTNGTDGNGNPQTGLVDVTPWLDDEYPNGNPTEVAENTSKGTVHPTVQDAVNNASADNTIEVSDGTHNGSTTIETSGLTIKPADGANPTLVGDGESVGSRPHATINVDDGSGPVRNVTIDGKDRLTVRNPDGKFGIFAGTGTTNSNSDGIGGLEIINTTVEDISTNSSGGSLTGGPAGIGIRGDYGTDGNPGIDIGKSGQGNTIRDVETSSSVNAVGITLKSFTGDAGFGFDSSGNSGNNDPSSPPATDTDIVDNTISKINGGDKSRTKGISVSGEFEDVLVEGNSITDITAADDGSDGDALAITFTENGGSYSGNEYDIDGDGNGERIGPRDFEIRNNDIDTLTADSTNAIFVGGYEDLNGGGTHAINGNTIKDGTVERFAGNQPGFQPGDEDALNLSNNTFNDQGPGTYVSDPSQSADLDSVFANNTFNRGVAVGKRAIFGTIQTAVGNANSGETIEVSAGTFNEEVSIGKNITLTEADGSTNATTISGQVRITDSVDSSNTLEVSDLNINYDSGDAGSGKKSTVLFEENQHVGVTLDKNTITAPSNGYAVYKNKSGGGTSSPDNNVTLSKNTFDTNGGSADQLVVIRSEVEGVTDPSLPENNNNSVTIENNDFDGTINRPSSLDDERGSALDHRAESGDIESNQFGDVSGTDIEPIASATGANTSIKKNGDGGNSGLDFEGESAAGGNLQTVLDKNDSGEAVRINNASGDGEFEIDAQNGTNQNKIQIPEDLGADVTIKGSDETDNPELQVPDDGTGIEVNESDTTIRDLSIKGPSDNTGTAIDVSNSDTTIKDVEIGSGSAPDTGVKINDSGCTLRDSTITVNPTAAIEINGGGNVIEDSTLQTASGTSGGDGILINNAGSSENLIALNDIDSDFENGIKIDSNASNVGNVKIRFNNIRGDSNAIDNSSGAVVDARSNFWNDKTGPSGGADDPNTGRTANGEGDAISSKVRYDEFLEISNDFILNTGSPSSGRDTDGDGLHEDFNNDGDHFPTDGYLFLRALRQGHFDRLADIDNPGGDLSTDYTTRFDFDGDGSDDISRSDVVSMVINRNRD